jgi:hypothetical protein
MRNLNVAIFALVASFTAATVAKATVLMAPSGPGTTGVGQNFGSQVWGPRLRRLRLGTGRSRPGQGQCRFLTEVTAAVRDHTVPRVII